MRHNEKRITITITEETHQALKLLAIGQGKSLNTICQDSLTSTVKPGPKGTTWQPTITDSDWSSAQKVQSAMIKTAEEEAQAGRRHE